MVYLGIAAGTPGKGYPYRRDPGQMGPHLDGATCFRDAGGVQYESLRRLRQPRVSAAKPGDRAGPSLSGTTLVGSNPSRRRMFNPFRVGRRNGAAGVRGLHPRLAKPSKTFTFNLRDWNLALSSCLPEEFLERHVASPRLARLTGRMGRVRGVRETGESGEESGNDEKGEKSEKREKGEKSEKELKGWNGEKEWEGGEGWDRTEKRDLGLPRAPRLPV